MIEIINGIAYQDKKPVILHIIDISALDGHRLRATFSDGVSKEYDMSNILEAEVFKPLQDEDKFKKVQLDHGVPTWEAENVDLSPETIYANGTVVDQ